jgi:hypothetical protein
MCDCKKGLIAGRRWVTACFRGAGPNGKRPRACDLMARHGSIWDKSILPHRPPSEKG